MLINKRLSPVFALLVLAVLMLVYCGDDTTEPVDPLAAAALCLSDSSCAMGAVCDTSSAIDVTNCGSGAVLSWTATEDAAWLALTVTSGETPAQFCLMADSNCTGAERTATVTVTADNLTDESIDIDVTQPSMGPTLNVSLSEWEAYCLGEESQAISVGNCGDPSSFDWEATEDSDWLELSASGGSTPGSFTITADTNDTQADRTATITVTAEGVAGSPWEITVAQPAVVAFAGNYDTPGYAVDVFVTGDYAYVADDVAGGLQIINVSDPAGPTLAGSRLTSVSALDVFVSGDYAYVANLASLYIINVSDPSNPTSTRSYDTDGYAEGVFVRGDYAYVTDNIMVIDSYGLTIINVSDPADPTLAGRCNTPFAIVDVFVSGDYAYVVNGLVVNPGTGLQIINVSDPAGPTLAGSYDTPGTAEGVYVSGDYAYVAGSGGFWIINVSDPSSPTLAGSYDTPFSAEGVYVSGDYAYVADGISLQIIDVSDPSVPTLAGSYDTPYSAEGVYVSGGYAYVADGVHGLLILKLGLRME